MIIVTGSVTAKSETSAEMTRLSPEHVRRSRQEPGCIRHDVSIDAEDPLRFHFIERWSDAFALKAPFAVPESRAFWVRLQELAADRGGMAIYEAAKIKI